MGEFARFIPSLILAFIGWIIGIIGNVQLDKQKISSGGGIVT